MLYALDVEDRELTRSEGGELSEGDTYGPIVYPSLMDSIEETTESRDHMSSVDSRWSEISVSRGIGVVTEAEVDTHEACPLLLREEGLIGSLEVHEGLSPEEIRIIRDTIIEGSTYHDTLPFLAHIMGSPGVDSMEFEPEDDTIASEELRDISRIERVVVVYRAYTRTEPLSTATSDEGDLTDGEILPYCFYILSVELYSRPIGLMEVAEHLRADTSRRYPDRYGDPDISINISLETFGECLILTCHPGHFRESLIDREDLELPETSGEIGHETIRDRAVVRMIRKLFNKSVFSYYPLCLPEGSAHTDTEPLRFIARRDRDLISDEDTLALQARVTQGLTRCIEGVAVYVCVYM